MRVLVAGASSTLGWPTVSELIGRGHEVVALTRSEAHRSRLEAMGARCEIADVLDRRGVAESLQRAKPEAVASLLITLPKRGPQRRGDFKETRRLWTDGVPNLLAAAAEAGARRFVGESVLFAYGYGRFGRKPLSEEEPFPGGAPPGGKAILSALRGMEEETLTAKSSYGMEGVVLRYGVFHGTDVPSTRYMAKMLRRRLLPVPGGGPSLLSFIEIGDAATATVAALERGTAGQRYNVADDAPARLGDYLRALALAVGAPPPRSIPALLAAPFAPYATLVASRVEIPLSNAKAKNELRWRPRFPTFEDALAGLERRA